jgi:hypothetical protein
MSQLMVNPIPSGYRTYDEFSLLVTPDGKLVASSTCCRDVIGPYIFITVGKGTSYYIFDNVRVILNGQEIGTVNLSDPNCFGRIFVTTNKYTATDPNCETINPTVEIPFNAFLTGINTIRIELVDTSGARSSYGFVNISASICTNNQNVQRTNSWVSTKTYLNSGIFNLFTPSQVSQTFTFEYP